MRRGAGSSARRRIVRGVAALAALITAHAAPASAQPDPLLEQGWHLQPRTVEPAGANVRAAWPASQGAGVVIGIVDDGLQHTHPDLQPNYAGALSFDFNFNDPDPSPDPSFDPHGTAVAGVAAARGENGIGVSGAAPRAALAGLRLIAAPISDATEAAALGHQGNAIHISSNSWGPADDGATLAGPGPLTQAAIANAVNTGRGGKGRIFTWAAGNGQQSADDCNFDGYANSRYVIAAGALADSGQQAFYSEPCAALFVTAPSSGGSRGITTTDLVGPPGFDFGSYTNGFGGTSSAAPLVGGAVALVLARNPSLGWRDVQYVLARSSVKVNAGDPGWSAGPFAHNEKFGFGLLDAQAAVSLAGAWVSVAEELAVPAVTRTPGVSIPDNDTTGVLDSVGIGSAFADFVVEHVEVELSASHLYRGDLEVTLTSPAGVESRLATVRPSDAGANFPAWRFGTVRHWGESAAGSWTLRVADRAPFDVGTWESWTLRIFGYRLFADLPASYWARPWIAALARESVTSGCGTNPRVYCPAAAVTREQMAVFLLRAKEGQSFTPPACATAPFADVPCSSPFAPWIQELVKRGVTVDCSGANYCPGAPVTREQMAAFLLRAENPLFTPLACITAPFADVPCTSPFASWIQELVRRGVTAGCGSGNYCPGTAVTRAEMAVFLVKTFDLPL